MAVTLVITADTHARSICANSESLSTACLATGTGDVYSICDMHNHAYTEYHNIRTHNHYVVRTWLQWPLGDPSLTAIRDKDITKIEYVHQRSQANSHDAATNEFYVLPSSQTGSDLNAFWQDGILSLSGTPSSANWMSTGFPSGDEAAEINSPTGWKVAVAGGEFGVIGNLTATITSNLSSAIRNWAYGEPVCGSLCFMTGNDYQAQLLQAETDPLGHVQSAKYHVGCNMAANGTPLLKITYSTADDHDYIDRVAGKDQTDIAHINAPPGVAISEINGVPLEETGVLHVNEVQIPGEYEAVTAFSEHFTGTSGSNMPDYWTNNIIVGGTDNREYGWQTDSDGTPSGGTGPVSPGAVTGTHANSFNEEGYDNTDRYMYMEASGRFNCTFVTETPNITLTADSLVQNDDLVLNYFLHMYSITDQAMGGLTVRWVGVTGGTEGQDDGTTASTHVHGPLRQRVYDLDRTSSTATFQLGLETNTASAPSASALTTGRIQRRAADDYQMVRVTLSAFHGTQGRLRFTGRTRYASGSDNGSGAANTSYWRSDMAIDHITVTGHKP